MAAQIKESLRVMANQRAPRRPSSCAPGSPSMGTGGRGLGWLGGWRQPPVCRRANTLMATTRRFSRLFGAVDWYRAARQEFHGPASVRSRRGLDWMNFFVSDVQTGFGTFVAFYLAQQGWPQSN